MRRAGSKTGRCCQRALAILVVASLELTGCQTMRSTMPAARQAAETKEQLQQLQARAMRFADEYVGRVVEEGSRLRRNVPSPDFRSRVAEWTLTQANAAYSNAAGPNPVVNALDPRSRR
jgi:hypothetical protein